MDGSQRKKKPPLLCTFLWLLWLLPVCLSWSGSVFVRKTGKQSHQEWRSVQKGLWSGTSAADQWTEKQRDTDATKKRRSHISAFHVTPPHTLDWKLQWWLSALCCRQSPSSSPILVQNRLVRSEPLLKGFPWQLTLYKEEGKLLLFHFICLCLQIWLKHLTPPPPSQIPVSVQNRSTLCWFIMKDLSKGVGASYLGSKRWGRWCWWCCSSVWRRTETTQLHTNTSFRNNLHWTGARPPNGQGGASEITDAHLSRTAKNCRKLRYGEEKL